MQRIRARLAAGELVAPGSVQALASAERGVLAELLNLEETPSTRAADHLDGFARPADFYVSDTEEHTLADLGLVVVRGGRDGSTVWDSDAAQHRQAGYASRDARRLREECHRDANRDALADARYLGQSEPTSEAVTIARTAADARADALIAALAV